MTLWHGDMIRITDACKENQKSMKPYDTAMYISHTKYV